MDLIKDHKEVLDVMSAVMGITGYSLRDFAKYMCKDYLKNIFNDKFNGKLDSERKKEILAGCLIELEDYIENSKNLDNDLFKAIGNVLINGIELEELYTREYIKILKLLSWLDLIVLIEVSKIHGEIEELECFTGRDLYFLNNSRIKNRIEIEGCPKELVNLSIDFLIEKKIIIEKEVELEIYTKNSWNTAENIGALSFLSNESQQKYKKVKIEYLSELGMKIMDLL
ncbi:hypothetical protein [Cetobacterium sp. ZWU0022]|uniref:hypothetical protein n=1 Tax=Cetobacterium sp. ZWU0022 TaxID=1340502 RepID=UPI0006460A82|nr:hypothetical protein [Cetobacterium sp. ZWU0022]